MALVKINGVEVDQDDPCALFQALYSVKLRALAGEHVSQMSIQSPVTRDQVVFSSANLSALDTELNRLASACHEKTTGRRLSRRWTLKY
ncbi:MULTISPECIES: hypothetical protein [Rhizobium/Agrobacterium group]|uniref:Uncharacterized protein n=1 Tax=Agrobacterium vitis TaxID=373 RepID=A0ABD6H541_AGRVI|nr:MULTISPECIES: hypothetical protein [Rhizobium/Agrobacterium group]MUO27444.1 hypothetical protein [Agrobacterium vitis]MUO42106.1 hypothetical protein [Agrobacterium vitis]MUP09414.1 hypothetical protein [Agrobacterium vitis]